MLHSFLGCFKDRTFLIRLVGTELVAKTPMSTVFGLGLWAMFVLKKLEPELLGSSIVLCALFNLNNLANGGPLYTAEQA